MINEIIFPSEEKEIICYNKNKLNYIVLNKQVYVTCPVCDKKYIYCEKFTISDEEIENFIEKEIDFYMSEFEENCPNSSFHFWYNYGYA